MDQNRGYIQKDWPLVLNIEWIKLDWGPRQRLDRMFVNSIRYFINLYKQVQPYLRIQSFLFSYVLLTPGAEGNQLLNAQIPLWNISRAIATAIILVTGGMSAIILTRMIIVAFIIVFRDLMASIIIFRDLISLSDLSVYSLTCSN
jgi:hypothetical protein